MKKNNFKKTLIIFSSLIILLITIIPFLVSCTGSIEGIEPNIIINNLFPNIWVLIGVLISSIILFTTIIYLVWKPTEKMIEKRRQYIMTEINDADILKQKANETLANAVSEKNNMIIEATKMVEDANVKAQNIIENAKNKAQKESNIIANHTLNKLKNEKIKIQHEIKSKSVDLAFELTKALISKNVNKDDNQDFVNQFIESFNKENK